MAIILKLLLLCVVFFWLLVTTLRKTLGQAVASLMWSVRMIGVALAFIAPWGVVLALLIWIVRKISSRKSQRAQKNPLE